MSSTFIASPLMIDLQDIFLRWKGTPVFEGLNLQIPAGESFGIIGPGGVGKTVLLKMMAGLIPPTTGKAFFGTIQVDHLPLSRRKELAKRLAMTFQRSGLFDSLTAAQNLGFPLSELGVSREESHARITQALKDVGLEGQGALFPHEMSGGMQKRLGIARALVVIPEVILYDDPTAGLDPITSRSIVELILEVKEKYQQTIVVVSSDVKVAYALSQRIGFLFQGRFLEMGSVESIRRSPHAVVAQFVNGLLEGPLSEGAHD